MKTHYVAPVCPTGTLVPVNGSAATVQGTVVVGNYAPTNGSPLNVSNNGGGTSSAPGPIQLVQ